MMSGYVVGSGGDVGNRGGGNWSGLITYVLATAKIPL